MGISVAFLKPVAIDSTAIREKGTVTVQRDNQVNLGIVGDACLPFPQSIIKVVESSQSTDVYTVTHYSDTIEEPIRLWARFTDETDKYQKKLKFDIIHDKKMGEVYLTAAKDTTNQFLQRANASTYLKLERQTFNLNLKKIPDILNVYGRWARTDRGNIRCIAEFGFDVNMQPIPGETTTLNMRVRTDSGECDMTISKEGQISSHTKSVTIKDIIDFYHLIKNDLLAPL